MFSNKINGLFTFKTCELTNLYWQILACFSGKWLWSMSSVGKLGKRHRYHLSMEIFSYFHFVEYSLESLVYFKQWYWNECLFCKHKTTLYLVSICMVCFNHIRRLLNYMLWEPNQRWGHSLAFPPWRGVTVWYQSIGYSELGFLLESRL